MVANTTPIFSALPDVGFSDNITAANTAKDGTGTVNLVFTAGANGSFLQQMICRPKGTNTASVMRVFLNNGAAPTTATNNSLIGEIGLPAITLSEVAEVSGAGMTFNFAIPAGYRIYVTLGTAVAAGWQATLFAGDY